MIESRAVAAFVFSWVLTVLGAGELRAAEAQGRTAGATASCEKPSKAKKFDDSRLGTVSFFPTVGFDFQQFSCFLSAKNPKSKAANSGQKNVKFTISGLFIDSANTIVQEFRGSGKTDAGGHGSVVFLGFGRPAIPDAAGVVFDAKVGGGKKINQADVKCVLSNLGLCEPTNTTLCLEGKRFNVQAVGLSGQATATQSSNRRGTFILGTGASLTIEALGCRDRDGNATDSYAFLINNQSGEPWSMGITDTTAGGTPTYHDFGALEEIQVTTGGADSQYCAGGINIVTR